MKRILLVTSEFPPQPGGIGNHALHVADALGNEGYKVTVVADQRSQDGHVEAEFDKTLPFSVSRIKKQALRPLMYINRVVEVFRLLVSADYVLASGKFALWNVAFCNIFRKRFSLAVVHGTEVNLPAALPKLLVEQALRQFDKVVAVSTYTKQFIRHLGLEVRVVPNGIACASWKNIKSEAVTLSGEPKLITVGRISERKGQQEVLKLVPELLKHFPEIHYHCVGIDAEAEQLKRLAKDLGVSNHFTCHGVLEQNKLKSGLAQSDIFIMLSKPGQKGDVEGFGIAILEANALGVPAIGAYGSGVEEAISRGQSGGLINIGDYQALKGLIDDILKNKESYRNGAEQWAKAHDWSCIVKQYTALLP
ncbi:glycosyltransferase family 4 protein [Aestuariibaculum suncheonense]|uniref:Glycosyltransferase family 4 protein n=1 Tax=Aestuariibaculum suncheonense TaxID=1028745 RepID=A0A8J6UMK2_9FLAO|nr:glycosyltransferase family 4 protein [Aestuariibaculum suncheonense]MBD0837001.1 glycosyltransferase family 4 protein [Aestuariibaculum suncheonense]